MLTPLEQETLLKVNQDTQDLKYGTITLTVIVKNGLPVPTSYDSTLMKRKKYPMPKCGVDKHLAE